MYAEKAASEDLCVWRKDLKQRIRETAGELEDVADDPTLPHTDQQVCGKCGGRDAVFFGSQMRTREMGLGVFFVCCGCGEVWEGGK